VPDAIERKRAFETYQTTVSLTESLTPHVKRIHFQLPAGATMTFRAGQFVQIFVPTADKPRRTSYSIASPPYESTFFELCVTLVDGGVSSTFLHNLKVGDSVQAMGPLGRFTLPDPLPRDIVFIATGSGIAPFRSMILDLVHRNAPQKISLVFGNRFDNDILYKTEWEELERQNTSFRKRFTLSRPHETWTGKKGYVQDALADFISSPAEKDYYICGLVKMIDGVAEKLQQMGVPKEQIHFERFD